MRITFLVLFVLYVSTIAFERCLSILLDSYRDVDYSDFLSAEGEANRKKIKRNIYILQIIRTLLNIPAGIWIVVFIYQTLVMNVKG